MVRMKKGEKGDREAVARWRETMEKRYGNISERAKKIGAKGGRNGRGKDYKGGFASNPELAKMAGALGGLISKRGPSKSKDFEKYKEEIFEMYDSKNYSMKEIAKKFDLPYEVVRYRINLRENNK